MIDFNSPKVDAAMEALAKKIHKRGFLKVIVHDGFFHADDVLCVAELKRVFSCPITIVRSRENIEDFDFMLDVGRSDKVTSNYVKLDHHQITARGERFPNGVIHCAYSKLVALLYRDNPQYLRLLNKKLAMPVAAADNGQQLDGVGSSPMGFVKFYNVPGKDKDGIGTMRFEAVVNIAYDIRSKIDEQIKAILDDEPTWNDAVSQMTNGIIVLNKGVASWPDFFFGSSAEDKGMFIIFPHDVRGWVLRTIPTEEGGFTARYKLPSAWYGAPEGFVEGGIFCHNNGFMAVFETKEDAIRAANIAIENI